MKQKNIFWLLLLIIMIFLGTGCSYAGESTGLQDFPDIGIPVKDLNQHLKINTPAVVPSFREEDRIVLVIENLTQSAIMIEPDQDVKIFKKSTSGWEPVSNEFNYNQAQWLVSVKGGDVPAIVPFGIYPGLYNLSEPTLLRVIVIGKPENLPKVAQTISYVDITVNP
jgi:hypothetical protein